MAFYAQSINTLYQRVFKLNERLKRVEQANLNLRRRLRDMEKFIEHQGWTIHDREDPSDPYPLIEDLNG